MTVLSQLSAALKDRYALDREIGHGGMATVYLARDVRHNRKVALKVLSPELGAVLGVERFLAEIEVTANLQHPNLLPLFDSGEVDGLLFYVMPYVEGESLRDKLNREKQLPVDEAVRMAIAVASALDYAHRHGVIHRDLKPENILMHEDQPLVADFGIALAVSNAGGNRITQTGLSLGTPHYMSPEQATGDRVIDARTDVYSLGAVTYEMLVGEPPHDGKTSQAIIAKVLTDKPRAIRLTRESVPAHVEAAVDRALAKLPADRYHTAHEFGDALAGKGVFTTAPASAALTGPSAVAHRTRAASRVRALLPWAITAVALAVAVAAWVVAPRAGDRAGVLRYEIPLPDDATVPLGRGGAVAISPNGDVVAYAAQSRDSTQRIYLRASGDLEARAVPGSDYGIAPFFSPDGEWVAFTVGGQLMRASVAGGAARALADVGAAAGGAWSPSGWLVISDAGVLVKVPATGGTPVAFTSVNTESGETSQAGPVALSDGRTILYASYRMGGTANARIGIASLDDGSSAVLDLLGTQPLGVLDGHLIYTTAAGVVMAAPFDLGERRLTGPPIALVDQTIVDAATSLTYARMSPDGALVYLSGVSRRQIVFVAADGSTRGLGVAGAYSWPRLSPDGTRLAVSVGSLSRRDVWIHDLTNGTFTRLTNEGTINDRAEWTADGSALIFRSNRSGRNSIWKQLLDGATPATPLFGLSDSHVDEGVLSPDARYLLFQRDSTGNGELIVASLEGDSALRRVETTVAGYGGRFSNDGRWIAYTAGAGDAAKVYVRPFPSLNTRVQISTNGGATPVWSADGRRIYYVDNGQLWVAVISSTSPVTVASRTIVLPRGYTFNTVHADFDVGRDGRVVALQSPGRTQQLVVVRNLASEVRVRSTGTPR